MKKYKLLESGKKSIQILMDPALDFERDGEDMELDKVSDFIYFTVDDDIEVRAAYVNYVNYVQQTRIRKNKFYDLSSTSISINLTDNLTFVIVGTPGTTVLYRCTTAYEEKDTLNKIIAICDVADITKSNDKIIPFDNADATKKLILTVMNIPYAKKDDVYVIHRESDDNFYIVEDGDVFDPYTMQLVGKLEDTDKRI